MKEIGVNCIVMLKGEPIFAVFKVVRTETLEEFTTRAIGSLEELMAREGDMGTLDEEEKVKLRDGLIDAFNAGHAFMDKREISALVGG